MSKINKPILKSFPCSGSVADALSTFYEGMEELRDEVQEAYDNMPESLQNAERGEAMSALADEFGFVDDAPALDAGVLSDLTCSWTENRRKGVSRATRRDNFVAAGNAALDALRDWLGASDRSDHGDCSDVEDVCSSLEEHVGVAEGGEFPAQR